MGCFQPIAVKNPKRLYNSEYYVNFVPCGKCPGCLESRRSNWSFRLQQEEKVSQNSTFLTLTYNDENLPILKQAFKHLPTFRKSDLQKYFKRVRSENPFLKYYAVAEYGGRFGRSHYHAIVFNADRNDLVYKWDELGFAYVGDVEPASIHYVTGYLINNIDPETLKLYDYQVNNIDLKEIRPWAVMSKGLGKSFINPSTQCYYDELREYSVIYPGGHKGTLPRYYRNHFFDEDSRSAIASINQEKILKEYEEKGPVAILKEREYKTRLINKSKKMKSL